jgi:hypothetical protein
VPTEKRNYRNTKETRDEHKREINDRKKRAENLQAMEIFSDRQNQRRKAQSEL